MLQSMLTACTMLWCSEWRYHFKECTFWVNRWCYVISFVSFVDVISIERTGENFRLIFDVKGRFAVHEITPEEAKVFYLNTSSLMIYHLYACIYVVIPWVMFLQSKNKILYVAQSKPCRWSINICVVKIMPRWIHILRSLVSQALLI